MFTGLVEESGAIRSASPDAGTLDLVVECKKVLEDLAIGDSVAVNGCCLTAVEIDESGFRAHVMGESLSRTNLGALEAGDRVNLERPLRADERFGGHIVQGHIDGPAVLEEIRESSGGRVHRYEISNAVAPFVIDKGSVAIDGVSLTVSASGSDWFEVSLIPHTLENTNLGWTPAGHVANLEVDVLAKYVESLLVHYRGAEMRLDTGGQSG